MANTSHTRNGADRPPESRRIRVTVATRLMIALASTAALAAALAMVIHDRALSSDLERAAQTRLERAGDATNQLIDHHLESLRERYRAISGTPQFRATLEVEHAPTLSYYTRDLRSRAGADAIAFQNADGELTAADGDPDLIAAVAVPGAGPLVAFGGRAYAVVREELHTSAGRVGWLLAVEVIDPATFAHWSELSGVDVGLAAAGVRDGNALARTARSLGDLDVRVTSDLTAEHEAMRRSRLNLFVSGGVAVGLSLVACLLLARGFVKPIRAIQNAANHIRRGDLDVRLEIQRGDEIGDVARTFDLMLADLEQSRRENEHHLDEFKRSQQHLANAQEIARLGSFEVDFEFGKLSGLRVSDQLRSLFEIDTKGTPIDAQELLDRVAPADRENLLNTVQTTLEHGTGFSADMRVIRRDGNEGIIRAQAHLVGSLASEHARLEGTVQDITDRRRAEEQIRYLAHHDTLTGLGNRVLFAERLDLAISQSVRRGSRLGVMLLDVDHFKRINDTFGQDVGDEVLRRTADRLVRILKGSDLVERGADGDLAVARLGGDEFAILLNDIEDPQDLGYISKRILDTLAAPLHIREHEIVLKASIGIATWPTDGEDVDSLLRSCTSAAKHAKGRNGGQYQFYDDSMNVAATAALDLEARIRRAIANEEFEMHYQPKIALQDGRVNGFEALIRWRDPNEGMIPPNHFIPVAEHCGLIREIGDFAIRSVCRQLATWKQERGEARPQSIAVNISAHQFKSGTLVEVISEALRDTGAPPEQLEIEITESAVVHDEKRVVRDLEELRGLGIRVSLDDFGTGQSSLSYLRWLPVDSLKIDISFIRNIAKNRTDAALAAAIIDLGHARGLCVVAEGVETDEQRSLLEAWGCDEIQGWLISPAVPAGAAIALVDGPGAIEQAPPG